MSTVRLLRGVVISVGIAACAGCAAAGPAHVSPETTMVQSSAPQTSGCTARVIVGFAQAIQGEPDAALVKDIALAAHVNLSYVRSISPALHVFVLTSGEDSDSGCVGALARLRADSRVRSVDIDARRKHM